MNLANLLPVGIASLTALALALPNLKAESPQTTPSPAVAQSATGVQGSELGVNSSTPNSRKRHKITLSLTSMDDLKVKEKDRIKEGDAIADRTSDRQRLEAKKKQLEIAIAQLSLPLTQLAPLPEPNLEQERVALSAGTARVRNGYQSLGK